MSDERTPQGRHREQYISDAPTGQMRVAAAQTLVVAGQTDKGRVRPGNEDSFSVEQPGTARARARGTLLVVSDGMGGHAAGEVASAMAVETIQTTYYEQSGVSAADAIHHAIAAANSAIYEGAQSRSERGGMGCTVVVMVVQGHVLTVGHVGDSRGYLIRGGQAHQITRDHSWVAMQVQEGVLTPEQAARHPNRSLLMRALGRQASVEVEMGRRTLQSGDVLIVCSDGLTGVVEDAEIAEYAVRFPPAAAAEQLIALANSRGAPDNVTVVAAAIHDAGAAVAADDSSAATVVVSAQDARTPVLGQPPDDATTIRQPKRASAGKTTRAATPPGTPVVLARESVAMPNTIPLPVQRRGRGPLLAGTLAVLGAALALTAIVWFRTSSIADEPRSGEPAVATTATVVPASKPAVPPPVATGLPGPTAVRTVAPVLEPTAPAPAPTTQPTPAGAQVAPGLAGSAAAAATTVAGVATQGILPALSGTPLRPPGVAASPAPTVAPPVAPAGSDTAATGAGGGAGSADAPAGAEGDTPAPDDSMTPAEGSGEEPAPADQSAPAPASGGPRLTVPDGGALPNIPGLRPKPRNRDD